MPPPKYKRLGLAQGIPAVESIPDQTLHTSEDFRTWTFVATGGGNDVYGVDTGILHRYQLPPTSTRHYIWIAAGAHRQDVANDLWYLQGSLFFFRGGRPVGFLLFGDACKRSAADAAQVASAMRKITRIAPDGNGSVQPSIRYQETSAPIDRNNLDMACIEIPVFADRVEYVCQASRINMGSAGGIELRILTGCRIVSVP